jgi:hypothetical protein
VYVQPAAKVSRAPLDKLPGEISHENEDNSSERAFIRGRRLIFAAPLCVCVRCGGQDRYKLPSLHWPMSREINANRCRWNVLFRRAKQPPLAPAIDETNAFANISTRPHSHSQAVEGK